MTTTATPNRYASTLATERAIEYVDMVSSRTAGITTCSTRGVDAEDVVVARRRKVEKDLARLAECHAGTGANVKAAA